ncbi:Transcription initiation factor TFIID subunit 1 [Blattella germanica]|nr:Transcription initiation factor TFIID subunit 1 [Blattella germanica]
MYAIFRSDMGDSEDEREGSDPGIDLTGFLFGNIDESGQLEDDVLDSESKRHLASLGRMGLGSILREVIDVEQTVVRSDSDSEEDEAKTKDHQQHKQNDLQHNSSEAFSKEENFDVKSPSAIDYSDITELADDISEAKSILQSDVANKPEDGTDYDADDEGTGFKSDTQLMPPPPLPSSEKDDITSSEQAEVRRRKLETPLAAMLPSKYANVDVTEIFPDFRVDKVLRFSRLFGPGKPSSLPQIWRSVRKRRRKRKQHQHEHSDSGSDQDNQREKKRGWTFNYAPPPTADMCESDDEEKLLCPVEDKTQGGNQDNGESNDMGPKVADWRFGPAQVWYDMLEVSETGDGFNYEDFPDEAYLMVSQLHWEDEVVWNGDDIKHKVMQKLNCKTNAAGWVPSSGNRTAQAFSQPGKGVPHIVGGTVRLASTQLAGPSTAVNKQNKANQILMNKQPQRMEDNTDDTWYSIFPVENEELVYGAWEDEVIWDSENMNSIPKPKILTLDPNDENIVLGIPDDIDPAKQRSDSVTPAKVKIPHPHVKKSKILLGKAGVINVMEEDAPPPPPKHYMPRSSESSLRLKVGGGNLIQHSTPVVELRAPFVQTHMGPMRLRNFHRPPMKRFSYGTLAHPGPHSVLPLLKHIKKKAKQREQERAASGGGDVFFMRTAEDLTGRDGDIVLIEFCEEHPPLVNQVGMCTKIKNYYKRRAGKDQGPQEYRYGEVAYAHTSPFLGHLPPGQSLQAVENNMYRAPIYEHKIPETDFLVIRTRQQYYIRELDALFVAGQECPLYEVPGPNSKRANNFVRDFLQDAGYGEKFLFTPQEDDDEEMQLKMDDEVKVAPWNTTRAYIQAIKGKCLLQLTGPADPTGCGEGFSYVRVPNKPTQSKEEQEAQPKRTVTGTDADLRRLSLNNAKALLRKFGVPEEERIFDLQNRVLSSNEVLSTDEGESSDEDSSDIEEMGKNIENMLSNKKTSTQLSLEKEEQERQELRKMIMGEGADHEQRKGKDKKKEDDDNQSLSGYSSQPGRVLKIYRTFRNAEGKEYTRVELVRKPAVIDTYMKIRTTKDEAFIRQFATLDEHQKEEMKREKRRIQEQLRRIKRNQERERLMGIRAAGTGNPALGGTPDSALSTPGISALGTPGVGHMRTNKACPLYQPSAPAPPVNVAMTEEQEEEIEKQLNADDEDLVNVDGTKVKLSGKLLKHAEEMKRRTLLLKVPKEAVNSRKKRRAVNEMHCDYLKRQQRPANRRRTDPVVVLSTILESILNEMRDLPDVQPFLFPVNPKAVPDYHKIVTRPMDLQTIRENLRIKKYQSREEFLSDVNQIVENSTLYNERLGEKEERLMRLEKAINPLLDDNDQVALSFILDNVVNNKLKGMSESWPFVKPVNKKLVKDYYNVVKCPMDLETIAKKVATHKYHNRYEFLADIQRILENCILYNGKDSVYTQKAEKMVTVCRITLDEYGDHLTQLERNVMNLTLTFQSQNSSPDHIFGKSHLDDFDFVDVEGDMESEMARAAQRPRKKDVLEEDLQFSSEDEPDDIPLSEGDPEPLPDDDSQQAAEAMVQLGNIEESMDVDPNYDPSDFLLHGLPQQRAMQDKIHDDLEVSESDEEPPVPAPAPQPPIQIEPQKREPDEEDEGGDLWF